jgi:hypothetical protein
MKRLRRRSIVILTILLIVGGIGIYKLDPTTGAIYISDSANGKYRCAVFGRGLIAPGDCRASLFDGHWPHRQLVGERYALSWGSPDSSDFRATWRADGVEINFNTGYGDNRDTALGLNVDGRQEWSLLRDRSAH